MTNGDCSLADNHLFEFINIYASITDKSFSFMNPPKAPLFVF